MRRVSLGLLFGAGLLAALLAACGGGAEPAGGMARDLLAREPDLVIEERAVLRPAHSPPWGEDARGWNGESRRDGAGRLHALAHSRVVPLVLPAARPEARTLVLEAELPLAPREGPRREEVEVRLNGEVVGSVELRSEPGEAELDVPAAAWRTGPNLLEIVLPEGAPRRTVDGLVSLALSGVRYGRERTARRTERGGWELDPGAGLRFLVEPYAPAALELAGAGDGAGRLDVRIVALEAAGTRAKDADPRSVDVRGGAWEGEVVLPHPHGGPLQLDLTWQGEGQLRIEQLRVRDARRVERLPIILISIDTLAAGHTSLYGYFRETTPNLEAFARDAVVFRRCASNAPWTSPSYASLFSGLYPTSASMKFEEEDPRFVFELPDEQWTLTEALRACGYRTAGFVDVIWLEPRFGFDQGFDHYDKSASDISHSDPTGGIQHQIPRALAWLDALEPDEPFFLFLHAYDVHGPYLPAEPWKGTFTDDGLGTGGEVYVGARSTYGTVSRSQIEHATPGAKAPDTIQAAPLVSAYDEEIRALDESFGDLVRALDARGILDRAVVVFTADHGESTGEHDYYGHGLLYDDTIHVPLVVRLPPTHAWAGGRWVESSVQLVDLYPTLLAFAGVADPGDHLHGRSLVPHVRGDAVPPAPTFSEGGIMRQSAVELDGWKLVEMHPAEDSLPWTMLSSPYLPRGWLEERAPELVDVPISRKVFRRLSEDEAVVRAFLEEMRAHLDEPVRELFSLADDPGETVDRSDAEPGRTDRLLEVLERCRSLREHARALTLAREAGVTFSEEDLRRLGELGYADGEEE